MVRTLQQTGVARGRTSAGRSPADFDAKTNDQRRASLKGALAKGTGILKSGGSSLDAVEAVIRILEDDPQFNAGKGSVFNAAGSHELDASIMDGKTKACGAVAGVTTVKNPITLARLVMTKTRHVLPSPDSNTWRTASAPGEPPGSRVLTTS